MVSDDSVGIFLCRGSMDNDTYFGLEPSTQFFGTPTYRDFLGSLADNPLVVRDGVVRQTRVFLDGLTQTANILVLLQSPKDGQVFVHFLLQAAFLPVS